MTERVRERERRRGRKTHRMSIKGIKRKCESMRIKEKRKEFVSKRKRLIERKIKRGSQSP